MNNKQLTINIGYLYGDLMNIYGDTGNIICLQKRAQWRGIKVHVKNITIGTPLKKGEVDLYFFGGGQDESQIAVSKDLTTSGKGGVIKQDINRGVPLLSICGGYQLLGTYYRPQKGPKLAGLGIFPLYTQAGEKRAIGNIVIQTAFGKVIGFENHSGKTFLLEGGAPFGKVEKGFGNNGEDQTEGCLINHAIGCYMHGSLLPKNPQLADWLIQKALELKYKKEMKLQKLDDTLELKAHQAALKKFS